MHTLAYSSPQAIGTQCNPSIIDSPLGHDKTKMIEGFITEIDAAKSPVFLHEIMNSSSDLAWKNEYSDFLNRTLDDERFKPLLDQEINEEDLKTIKCPQLNKSTKEQKKKFYILYLAAISEATSDYNPNDESYSKSDKTTNYGLLQIDAKSAEQHASSVIEKPIDKDHLTNYQTNLKVGAYILKHQIAGKIATGRLFPTNIYYWSVLKNSKERVLKTFKQNSANLPFCNTEKIEAKIENSGSSTAPLANGAVESYRFAPLYNSSDLKLTLVNYPTEDLIINAQKKFIRTVASDAPTEEESVTSPLATRPIRFVSERPTIPTESVDLQSPAKEGQLHDEELEFFLKNRVQRENRCAQGVRESLNVLFGKMDRNGNGDIHYGETDPATDAKNYNEKFLRRWRTADSCFKETTHNAKDQYHNYDIRVLQPKASNKAEADKKPYEIYGHIEFFFNGFWYSDHDQATKDGNGKIDPGSIWDGWLAFYKGDLSKMPYGSSKLYRFSNCKK